MANVSFSMVRGFTSENTLAAGTSNVTVGTLAPNAGDIEVRISTTNNITKREIEEALESIFRFLSNPANSTTIPL